MYTVRRKRPMKIFLLTLSAIAAACAATSPGPPKLRLDDSVAPLQYSIDLTLIPGQDTFSGTATIDVDVRRPSTLVWLNATELDIHDATFTAGGRAYTTRIVPGGKEFAGLALDAPLPGGKAQLSLHYTGKISKGSSVGLFQMQDGGEWYLYSQFEPTDARRAFPCFDEPGFKTPWQLTLHVRASDMALSNTPEAAVRREPDGMKAVTFRKTAPLPSYLVALAVGPFDAVDAGRLGKTPLRVITPKGRGAQAKYAAEVIPQLLKRLEEYFGTPYPFEKLDSIAMPISNFAMENVGLITYSQGSLLARPESDTINRQRGFASVAAHEMAHQWFGDLVTTAWWNDIWLNEAFATWMESKIVGEWKPEWKQDVEAIHSRLGAMNLDSLVSARKIRQPIEAADDIANAFDGITYEKGAAVLRMFEGWMGPDKFRAGVRLYIHEHADGNATTPQFLASLGKAAGQDIVPAFNSFLDQAGVPLLKVKLECGAGAPKLAVTVERSLPIGSRGSSKENWLVPMCVKYADGGSTHRQCALLSDPRSEITLTAAKSCPAWVNANDQGSGYYRVSYEGGLLERVLVDGGKFLSAAERVSALGDVNALVSSGKLSAAAALQLVPRFSKDPDRLVVESAIEIAAWAKGGAVPDDLLPNGARFLRQVFGAKALDLGWSPRPGDDEDTRLLRQSLVSLVAESGDEPTLTAEAAKLARLWLDAPKAVDPQMASTVLRVAAEHGDRELFDRLRAAAKNEKEPRQRQILIGALGRFRDPALASAGFELLLSKEFDPRQALFPLLFGPLNDPATRDLPFEFVRANIDKLLATLPREVGGDFAASLPFTTQAFCDATRRARVEEFFQGRVKEYSGGPRNLAHALERIDLCIARREALGPGLAAFLKNYGE